MTAFGYKETNNLNINLKDNNGNYDDGDFQYKDSFVSWVLWDKYSD